MKDKKTQAVSVLKLIRNLVVITVIGFGVYQGYQFYARYVLENKVLKEIITRLEADSRIAEALVTDVQPDAQTGKQITTIKFLEYDTEGRPLEPKYFVFKGDIIQFQSLVVRFDHVYVRGGDRLRGKSVYLFWKAFILEAPNTQESEITRVNAIPQGYKVEGPASYFEKEFWQNFWDYALDPKFAKKKGIKNAQLEAPGTKFVPGVLYTLKIEHDGGIRIDPSPIPAILKGEKIME